MNIEIRWVQNKKIYCITKSPDFLIYIIYLLYKLWIYPWENIQYISHKINRHIKAHTDIPHKKSIIMIGKKLIKRNMNI